MPYTETAPFVLTLRVKWPACFAASFASSSAIRAFACVKSLRTVIVFLHEKERPETASGHDVTERPDCGDNKAGIREQIQIVGNNYHSDVIAWVCEYFLIRSLFTGAWADCTQEDNYR